MPAVHHVAAEFVQKFANYGQRLAVVGDISGALDRSASLRDFVREINRGRQVLSGGLPPARARPSAGR